MKKNSLTLTAVLCLFLAACVGDKKLTIYTQPEGAEVYVNGTLKRGKTPMTLDISQKRDIGIVVSKEGYETAAKTLKTKSSWWLSLIWTKNDPRAQYIEEDEVSFTLNKIPTTANYKPSVIPPFVGGSGASARPKMSASEVPALRTLPSDLETL